MEQQNNKYYTPTIDELYEGFECECWSLLDKKWISCKFSLKALSLDSYGNKAEHAVYFWIENKLIRVKYLDKEDIESLGWKLKAEEVKGLPYKSHFCTFLKDKNELHIQLENVNGYYPNKVTIRGAYLNINPLIKNKSELKRLMKQLGIYE